MMRWILIVLTMLGGLSMPATRADQPTPSTPSTPSAARQAAAKQFQDGNYKDALEGYARLAVDPQDDPAQVGEDLLQALRCDNNLGRNPEIDDLREKVIAVHANNWKLLAAAGDSMEQFGNFGYIVAGKFYRGNHRGGDGKYVMTSARDRVRALQLYQQAAEKLPQDLPADQAGPFYLAFARHILQDVNGQAAWRLGYLTDLATLPDYEEGYRYFSDQTRGAPVDAAGNPIYYTVPKTWKDARNDGQRWRWCLLQATETSPALARQVRLDFANFLRQQFDVQTMAGGGRFGRAGDDEEPGKEGPFAVRTLGEEETIARLANGIKRFVLPDEFNFIHIYQQLAKDSKDTVAQQALDMLGSLFSDRQQYDRSAGYWQDSLKRFGDVNDRKRHQIDQILQPWGTFEGAEPLPAGTPATVDFRFRNGTKLSLEAYEIDIPKLLGDIKDYINSKPAQLDWSRLDPAQVGYLLVEKNEQKYLRRQAAQWAVDLQPRPGHFDKRVTLTTPLKAAGAYFIRGQMVNGNTSRIILWIADTAIVRKNLDGGVYYFVADALTGAPVPNANLDFFGYQQRWQPSGKVAIDTAAFAKAADGDGQLVVGPDKLNQNFSWLVTATTATGRLAFLGFAGAWIGHYSDQYDYQYNQTKTFFITDRPVYRPGQTVHYKFWVAKTQFDQDGKSPFAGQHFTVQLHDPRGQKQLETNLLADDFGGFDGSYTLPKDASLGQWSMGALNNGGGNFRVEEYKKPEFEVQVDAPSEPVLLGEKISATITAKYYFGAPVTQAKVKYKVLRTELDARWYPAGRWDWFYEPGYWWFAGDYPWYPGWANWGCPRPLHIWWGWRAPKQPEVVAENEVPIGANGTVKVEIDTALAKALHGDTDHKYEITAEVTDQSRRTINGAGAVMVARKPFKVYAWVERGYYRVGDQINAGFNAQTLANKPVQGKGTLKLLQVTYDKDLQPVEKAIQEWTLPTNEAGQATQAIKASAAGQYRLSYSVTDAAGHTIEGGYVFCVRGDDFDGNAFRFNDIELVTDKREYQPGEKVRLMINTNRTAGTVLLFIRPANNIYLPPQVLHLQGKSTLAEIDVVKKDMPNFFIEAVTVSGAKVFQDVREVVVPPESRMLNVTVTPSKEQYKPGEKATVAIKLTGPDGLPFVGSAVLSIYDKAVEYISGGSNVPEIRSFFWKWRRQHRVQTETSLQRFTGNLVKSGETTMEFLGVFGQLAAELPESGGANGANLGLQERGGAVAHSASFGLRSGGGGGGPMPMAAAPRMAPGAMTGGLMAMDDQDAVEKRGADRAADKQGRGGAAEPLVEPTIRKNFADTALWSAALTTDATGTALAELTMPESLTTWKTKVWSMGAGTRVGQGEADVVTTKNLIIRLEAPRFFVQKDQVVLSAVVHNYLKTAKPVTVSLDLPGNTLSALPEGTKLSPKPGHPVRLNSGSMFNPPLTVPAGGEARINWLCQVTNPGTAIVRMSAKTDEESDAMEQSFPVYIHGMLKTDSFSGAIANSALPTPHSALTFTVPQDRKPEESRLEVRYSPSVACAMVDALPYMADYPYGCTEQTLNRFLPAVITQKILLDMHLDLNAIAVKRTNLNAQEIGNDKERAAQWQRCDRNPVFELATVQDMVKEGLARLGNMQCGDGGWGWFSGYGEQSYPHTTALVVHGLQIARQNDVKVPPQMLSRGLNWLKGYQADRLRWIKGDRDHCRANDLDALVYMVLADEKIQDKQMMDYLYTDRNDLSVYAKALFGLALHLQGEKDKLAMILQNIRQFVVEDNENQTAYLKLPENNWWWCWYGSEFEAQAYYIKLLAATDPKSDLTPRLAKYLINNRKHATYWNSTRDTALCIEALAAFIRASGEDQPDMTLALTLDGKKVKEVTINAENLFTFDNKLVLTGAAVTTGKHVLGLERKGTGPVYYNAYLTNFTLEDPITHAGLEIKVGRKFYKLVPVDKKVQASGSRGQAVLEKVEKYERQELADLATLKSGDLLEVELEIDSKNDYEYILFEDMKAAGCEAVEVRSGYNGNDLGAYMELRDERVCFFARTLARGKHSVSYRLHAEIPGTFSALPTKASAMYAPELKANSDEMKLKIEDQP